MELLVYKASAGSGKTFTLAVQYIRHLILNPRAYRQILAVTFTNKATTEMKERILQQLYGIWSGAPDSDAYLEQIKSSGVGYTDEELRQRAGTALQYMLHDYSRFRVETIDSFFQSVMRNLARELDLSPNLNIELDNDEVLSDAVDSLVEKLTPASPVLTWLLDYINERIADDKRWNVTDEIKIFGRNIFKENYIERGESLRERLKNPDIIKLYKNILHEVQTEALEQMKGFYDQFEGELEEHGLTADDLKRGHSGIGSYFRKLRDGKLSDKDVINDTMENCLANANNWASKTSPRKDEIIQLAKTSLMQILADAERLRPLRLRAINSCRLSMQHLNKLQLLNHIDEEVRIQNREHNRFLLSDTNALLHRLMSEGDSSFVFEKIGANIRNVMIDEFQDTSRLQWDNFRLLLLEGLSQGADSLIVGDVKQSIYRWRNGDWKILNDLSVNKKLNNFPVRIETLKTNRRSETNIINFNNQLFTAAVEYLNVLHLNELNEECRPLKRAYADVVQESPKSEAKGYVKVAFLEPDDEHDYTEKTLIALGEEVQRLLEKGVQQNDIAILVRKNKNIPLIADHFDKELQLPVVSDEAFRLDASSAICLLMDALRYLSNPENLIARASLSFDAPLPQAFTSRMDELRLMPLYELLEELFTIFQLNRIEKQDAYLFSFFDAVTDFLQNNPSELDGFIRYWDETLCSKTIPSSEINGIRILSIHKSKGLEFHTVLIPFCDWKLENETNDQLVWCVPEDEPYNAISLVPVNYSSLMAESVYRDDYLQERLQLWVDNLNLLYVAFTRAGKNLILWSKQGQRNTMSELLTYALSDVSKQGIGQWDEAESIYECGGPCVHDDKQEKNTSNKLAQKPRKLPVHMESMLHEVEFRQSNRSADFIAGIEEAESSQRFINHGRLLHTLFSAIETEADIDNAIAQLVFDGVIGQAETEEEIRALTRRAFALPQVKDWYSGSWELFNECDIIWQENGELKTRRPDRVMMRNGEVIVVDFKFGKPNKKYNSQVQEYMQLLARMGYETANINGYLWYVEEERIENVPFA